MGAIRLVCGKCRSKLDDLPEVEVLSTLGWTYPKHCCAPRQSHENREPYRGEEAFRCRKCKANYPLRHDTLYVAYRRAVAEGRHSIVLPGDVRNLGTGPARGTMPTVSSPDHRGDIVCECPKPD